MVNKFQNLSGTTSKSFRIGPKGLTLVSEAVTEADKDIIKRFKVEGTGLENDPYLAYDVDIPIYAIESIDTNEETGKTTITLFNRDTKETTSFTIITNINNVGAGNVSGPESSIEGGIAVFADNTGTKLADSQKKISEKINSTSAYVQTDLERQKNEVENASSIPTNAAVVDYVGELSEALRLRLAGALPLE